VTSPGVISGCLVTIGSSGEVLRALSDGARVHSVFWNANAYNSFAYAVYGTVLVSFAATDPYSRSGTDPDVCNPDLADIFAARPDDDSLDGDWGSALLATVERRTGVALDAAWLDRPLLRVTLPPLPADPSPPTATFDLDLDAAYRLASQRPGGLRGPGCCAAWPRTSASTATRTSSLRSPWWALADPPTPATFR
jgi:hypothetical protein